MRFLCPDRDRGEIERLRNYISRFVLQFMEGDFSGPEGIGRARNFLVEELPEVARSISMEALSCSKRGRPTLLSITKVRKYHGTFLNLYLQLLKGEREDRVFSELYLLKSRLTYDSARGQINSLFFVFLNRIVEKIGDRSSFERGKILFEGLVGFLKGELAEKEAGK